MGKRQKEMHPTDRGNGEIGVEMLWAPDHCTNPHCDKKERVGHRCFEIGMNPEYLKTQQNIKHIIRPCRGRLQGRGRLDGVGWGGVPKMLYFHHLQPG